MGRDAMIIRNSGEIPTTAAWAAIQELCDFYGPDARAWIGARVAGDGRKFPDGRYLEVRIGYTTPCGWPESQQHLVGDDGKVR